MLWKEGEEVDLPAATAAQEEMWAIAELPPQEVPAGMRKDVIPVEDAQGGPRSPRRFLRLLALLLAAFALLSAVWYFTAYRPMMFTWSCGPSPGGGRLRPPGVRHGWGGLQL